jgi:hypothetical protein
MSGIRSALSTTAIIAGGGLALLTGGIAKADPVAPPVPVPNVPGVNVVEQLMDPSMAPQLLQAAASLFNGQQTVPATPAVPTVPALPVGAPPVASASLNVPQPTLPLPGMPGAATPTLPGMPGATPALPASTAGTATQPGAQLSLPQVPGLPVPLPQQVSLPTEVTSLLGGTALTPAQAAATASTPPAAASPGTAPVLTSLFPTSALP